MHTNENVGDASDHPGQTLAAPGDPPNSTDSDSNLGDKSSQLWDLLFDSALDLMECEDPVPLDFEYLSEVRKQAAEIVRELRSLRRNQHQGDAASSGLTAPSQEMADRLVKLTIEAHRIASKNILTIQEYWHDSDRPQEDFQESLDDLCDALEEFGLESPGSDERRIRKAAFEMSLSRNLYGKR